MIKLEDFVMDLAKKYRRQNQEMHEDFQVVLEEMRKQLGTHRRHSNFMSSASIEPEKITVQSPSNAVRCFEDLTEVNTVSVRALMID